MLLEEPCISESVFIISTLQVWQRCWNQMQLLILAISSDRQVEKRTMSSHYLFFRWLNFNRLKCKTSTTYTVENTPQDFTINSCHHSTSEMGFFIHDSTTGASTLLHIVQHSARRKINSNLILRLLALHSLTFDILLVKWVFSKSLTCNNKKQLRWKSVSYCFHSILHLPRKIYVNHWIINCLKEIKAPHTSSHISNASTGFCTLYLHETWQETKKLDSLKAYIIPSLNMRTIPDAKNSLTLEP